MTTGADLRTLSSSYEHGYQVGINTPYANAIAPETGYTYNSIMIEVNKRRYLNEQTLEMTEGAICLRKCMDELYSLLKNYWEEV